MLTVGDQIRVVPKTNSAKRAVSSGLGSQVTVVDVTDTCDTLKGVPAYQIAPRGNPAPTSPHARWVAQLNDRHFRVLSV